ncbi:MAG: trypsin-like peptidase domain-containing protein [Planctomycetaceae bacterium]
MKHLAGCLLAGVFASLMTVWWLGNGSATTVTAQDRRVAKATPVEQVDPSTTRLYNAEGLTPDEAVNVAVYEAVNRGVVNITSKVKGERFLLMELQSEGSGSGAVIDHEGHILTNYHVVQDAKEVQVTLFNGESYDAQLVGADPLNDLAVIRIDAPTEELFPVSLGESRGLRVGMRVFAIGNPFGLERTLTTGIISSLNRSLQIRGNWTIKSIIQIDAAINPGSSGGPLLDAHGRLIGINTAIATTTGQSAGVGFAIPSSLVMRVVPQLMKHGRVIRPEIGIARVYQTEEGLLVAELRPHGPAEKAGLKGPKITRTRRGPFVVERVDRSAADLIVAVDDQKVVTAEDFLSYIEEKRPGESVVLTLIRDGKKQLVDVPLISAETQAALKE